MSTIDLKLPGQAYQIQIQPGALRSLGRWVREVAPHGRAVLLADAAVVDVHGTIAGQSLSENQYDWLGDSLVSGEQHKNLATVSRLYDLLVDGHIERQSPIIALGGGVVGDTVGFLASTYLRGVPFIQCPTTLLAMVDASVGGKVGVNLPQGKNLVGSFYQPRLVVADTDTLATLPARELRCGLAECVKHAVIRDAELFAWIGENIQSILSLQSAVLTELVSRNVQIKADVVALDEKEAGQRAHLNLGHTFAHAIEATMGYGQPDSYHHGEAVSLGMVAATRLAVDTGRCDESVYQQIKDLLNRIGLPTCVNNLPPPPTLMDAMRLDKKVVGGQLKLVLPDRIGAVSIVGDIADERIALAWKCICQAE